MLGSVLGNGGLSNLGSVGNITLSDLVLFSWEEDELALVAFKSLHVQLKGLLIGIMSSMVNSNADSSGKSGADLCLGELLKGEASAVSHL